MQQLWQTFCDSRRAAATGITIINGGNYPVLIAG
jgi:hypothetical protein